MNVLRHAKVLAKLEDFFFHVVLVEPEIPQNTGNIGRTCVGTGCDLHLVGKLGFEITDSNLKRAGLDYWKHLTWHHHRDLQSWMQLVQRPERVFYFSAKAQNSLYQQRFEKGDWLVFGKETSGLPDQLLQEHTHQSLLIPLLGPVRGLNVATSVAVAVYEGLRQVTLPGFR